MIDGNWCIDFFEKFSRLILGVNFFFVVIIVVGYSSIDGDERVFVSERISGVSNVRGSIVSEEVGKVEIIVGVWM